MIGVSGGLVSTLGLIQPSPELMTQMAACLMGGALIGGYAAKKIEVTDLPQMVALFHRLVAFPSFLFSLIFVHQFVPIVHYSCP